MEGCFHGPEELSTEDLEEAWSEGEYNFDGGISTVAGNNLEEEGDDGNDDDFMSRSWPPNGDYYGERTIDFTSQYICCQQDHNYQKQQLGEEEEEEEEEEESWNPQELFNRLLLRFRPIRSEEQQRQQKEEEEAHQEEDFKRCLFVSEAMNGEHRRECFVRILAILLVCQLAFLALFFVCACDVFVAVPRSTKVCSTYFCGAAGEEAESTCWSLFERDVKEENVAIYSLFAMTIARTIALRDHPVRLMYFHRVCVVIVICFAILFKQREVTHLPSSFENTRSSFALTFAFVRPIVLIYSSAEPDSLAILLSTALFMQAAASAEINENHLRRDNAVVYYIAVAAIALAFNIAFFKFLSIQRRKQFAAEYKQAQVRRCAELALIQIDDDHGKLERIAKTTGDLLKRWRERKMG